MENNNFFSGRINENDQVIKQKLQFFSPIISKLSKMLNLIKSIHDYDSMKHTTFENVLEIENKKDFKSL